METHRAQYTALLAMGAALLAMVLAAAVFKLDNPGLVRQTGGEQSERRQQAMDMINRMMQRLQENPDDREALRRLAETFSAMRAWERANGFWQRLVALEEDNQQARQQLAMTYFQMEKYDRAAAELKTVLESDPGAHYAHFNLGILYAHYLDAPDKAVEHLRSVIQASQAPDSLREEARKHLRDLQ